MEVVLDKLSVYGHDWTMVFLGLFPIGISVIKWYGDPRREFE